jgi:YD repeat-containing protein
MRIRNKGLIVMKFLKYLVLIALFVSQAQAGVNLKNGNFYITYTDIVVPGGGHDLVVERTYNSRSPDKGWFGYGWGSDYETYLTVSADGSVVVHENGSGAKTRFTPRQAVDADAAAKKIVDAMRKKTSVSERVANSLISKLKNDAELRQAYAKRFNVQANLAVGTELFSNVRGLQKVIRTKDGFLRKFNDGIEHSFNKDGKLVKVKDKNGYIVNLSYKNNVLESLKDSMAKQIFFKWYPDGKIKSVESGTGKKTFYKYDQDENLIEAKDVAGNMFQHKYDKNHNMTEIKYKDGSAMKIAYTKRTQFVEQITKKTGETVGYKYESNPKNPELHYWTLVTKKSPSGSEVTNRYEYEIKKRPDGSHYTYRVLTVVNNVKTETIYTECCSLPKQIKRGNYVTNFEYNKKGLLVKKNSSRGDFVELDYHPQHNKITKVVNNTGWTNFEYDKKGNLKRAQNSDGMSVLLIYDSKGRISKMMDVNSKTKKKRSLSFIYNAQGKPVEIAMAKVGKINVKYDNYGEILKVESKAGHRMALQVTQAFQSLLAIVKPAGVNLNL